MIDDKIQEELRNRYNPNGSELRTLQLQLLDCLKHFDAICKANGINYWLSSGSCLGAIRHGGFIPWDDDIDIEMTRKDYRKFTKIFTEDEHYVLQTYKNDLYYTQPFGKFRSKDIVVKEGDGIVDGKYRFRGLFIDIFVMEKSPLIIATISHILVGSMRYLGFKINKRNSVIDFLYMIIKKIVYGTISLLRLFCVFSDKNILRHTLGTGLENNIRIEEEIFPLGEAIFEGVKVPIPGNYDSYLSRMFGDYMQLPSKIHTHKLSLNKV